MKKPDYTIPTKDGGPGQVTVEHERDLPVYITPTEAMLAFEAGWAATTRRSNTGTTKPHRGWVVTVGNL